MATDIVIAMSITVRVDRMKTREQSGPGCGGEWAQPGLG